MFRASVISIPNELVKEVNSILYSFIWNGKDKVKRCVLISDIDKGGLKMLDIRIYDSVLCKKQTPPTAQQKITDKYSDTVIIGKRFTLFLSVLHLILNWDNFNAKFLTTLSLQMINYFASAFRTLQIAHILQWRTRILRTFTSSLQSVFWSLERSPVKVLAQRQ